MAKVVSELDQRKKKLDAISRKIALYTVTETYSDEREAQQSLVKAMSCLDDAKNALTEHA